MALVEILGLIGSFAYPWGIGRVIGALFWAWLLFLWIRMAWRDAKSRRQPTTPEP